MPVLRLIPSPVSGPSNRAGGANESRRPTTRSLSRITEDDSHDEGGTENNVTPRQSTHRRQASLASGRASRRSKSHTALSMTERGSDIQTPRVKRAKIRPSLAGPLVHEMNIDTRAQILIPIAEDCIVQLLKAGLNGTIYRRNTDQSWRLAWDSLQSQRRNKIFSPDSLPFNDFEDVREAFHASVRGRINTASLERAIHLSNLATFLWVILQPDEAHTLLGGTVERSKASTRSNRRLGSVAAEEDNLGIRDAVSRRNRVFGMAWKRYWKDVIPHSMRGNKHAIQLWARLSVQIMMIFRSNSVDGKSNGDEVMDLPEPDPEAVAELFSASAIARYGQWTSEVPSAHDAEIKDRAQRRWTDVAKQRRTELREVREDVLVERYPYDEFRRDMLAYIDEAVLHTLISHSVSPRKPTLDHLFSSASTSEQDDEDVSQDDKEGDDEKEADITIRPDQELDDSDPEPFIPEAEAQSDAKSAHEPEVDLDLDLDILGQILQEMTPEDLDLEVEDQEVDELETDENDFPSDLDSVGGEHGAVRQASPEQDELEEVDDDITVDMDKEVPGHAPVITPQGDELQTDSDDFPSELNSGDEAQGVEQGEESESDWIVKDAPIPHSRTRKTERSFEFAARQVSAEQVAWDSQSLPHSARRTARTPLFLPHQGPESETSRSASATPRPHSRPPAEVIPARPTQSPDENRQDSSADLDDMMPASSVLGTPRVIDLTQEDVPGLAPSPMRRDQSTETGRGSENEHGQMQDGEIQGDTYDSVDGDHDLPSNSPSPQRPNADRVGVDMLREPHAPIPSSSRIKPTSNNRLAARSQRVSVDPRKRRRIEADFASASSSDDDVQILDLPPIHASSTPRPPTRRPPAPLAEIPQNIPKQSPRSPVFRRRSPISKRDFIIVPKAFRRAPAIEHAREAEREMASQPSRRSVSRSTQVDEVEQDIPPQTSRRSLSRTENDDRVEQDIAAQTSQRSYSHDENDDDVESDTTPPGSRRIIPRGPLTTSDEFLHDEDGSPLEADPDYSIPPTHRPKKSLLHGRINGQVSGYTRMAGGRRWTDEQQLLLYRTIQKIPLDELHPCSVVWYLHGEYGTISHDLEDYNPQHMKDKMKTIVQVRYNNESPVEGRARFWLPPVPNPNGPGVVPHPEKLRLQREVDEACKKRTDKEREIHRARAEEALRKKNEEKAKKAAEREKAKQAKRGKGKGKGRKRAARSPSEEEEEDEKEDDGSEEEQVDTANNAVEGEDETNDPGPSSRSRRPTRATQARKAKTQAAAKRKSSRATKAAAPGSDAEESSEADNDQAPGPDVEQTSEANDENEEADQEQAQEMEVEASPDAPAEQAQHEDYEHTQKPIIPRPPRRRRQIPYIELPVSRSSSKAPRVTDRSETDNGVTTSQQAGTTQPGLDEDQLESLETIYEAPSSGKMMKRTPHQPVLESFDVSESATDTDIDTDDDDDDDEDDDATPTGDDPHGDEAAADVDEVDEADSPQDELEHQSPKSELESEEDETDKYARIAEMNRLKQKVLGGWEE